MGCRDCRDCKECGCDEMYEAACTFIQENYPEIGISEGDSLEDVFSKLSEIIVGLGDIQDGVGVESSNLDENNELTFTLTDGTVVTPGTIDCQPASYTVLESNGSIVESGTIPSGSSKTIIVPPSGDAIWTLFDEDGSILTTGAIPAGGNGQIEAPNATLNIDNNSWSILSGGSMVLYLQDSEGNPVNYTVQGNIITLDDLPKEKELLILPYREEESLASTLNELRIDGTILDVHTQNLTNVVIKKNGNIVTTPFSVVQTDVVTAEFDPATEDGAVVLDMTGSFIFP